MTRSPTAEALAASFNRAARTYLDHAGVQEAMADWLADWVPKGRHGKALEVGAGPGIFTRHLLPWSGLLTASDLSEAMCEKGRQRIPGINWQPMAAETPSGGPWDWIFSSSMLQWVGEPEAVFSAWRKALSSRGRILGGLFVEGSLPEWKTLSGGVSPLVWRTPDFWNACLEKAGLKVLRSGTVERVFVHDSARAFLRSLHGVGAAPARHLPAARLRGLMRLYEERFRVTGGVAATWKFYRFEAAR